MRLSLFTTTLTVLYFFNVQSQTFGSGLTDIDGNIYTSVIIGNQEWMVENLKVSKFSNGDTILNETDAFMWGNSSSPYWCYYNNNPLNDTIYGKLYNWYTVSDNRNVCPSGWHVPAIEEWDTLVQFLGGNTVAGGKLKEIGITHWASPNTDATNESGFTALPGGYRSNGSGNFSDLNYYGQYWSSTVQNAISGFGYYFQYDNATAALAGGNNRDGLSVRCVKQASSAGLIELEKNANEILKILDVTGREINFQKNTIMIFIYQDGSSKKVFIAD